ncbi:MAG: HEAT repeat domain-containing protein [Verrucomicrobia bacterium]|nr:HEAT repeat domain-containing protein [Verrucomicrobiota bacterium]MBU6446117.1 HEAT repeat domain-containing protein [Verrucomicrobiota bacterium]MDE3047753.1 HEAT repeat domain-containing protein [Verrucomicrobiota bacterium]
MGLSKTYLTLLTASLLIGGEYDEIKLHSLYLMQHGQIEDAIERYREYADLSGTNDFEVLQQMGLILLQKGIQSPDNQTFMMTLFGAGLSGSAGALEILEKGLSHPDPQIQLLALHFIAKIEDDRTAEIFNRAMSSDFLAIRMEAAFYMAQTKHPHAVGQIEGLMVRLPPMFKPFFPSLFALLGTSDATHALRRLIEDPDPNTRVESILHVARLGRDDFLPALRKRLTHTHIAELEAAAFAMGALKDSLSIPRLRKLAQSPTDSIRLAASLALFQLGDRSHVSTIARMAKQSNLFAISALGAISETEETLAELVKSNDLQVRTNAAIALLQRRDPRCLETLCEILITDSRDLAFHPFHSVGRTLSAIKAIPSAELHVKDPMVDLNYSLAMREHLLRESIHLPAEVFLQIARRVFMRGQNDLVPTTIALLENLQTDRAIALLKEGAEKIHCPLIRDYCHLSLFRLKQEGPYEEYVNHWVMHQKGSQLIQLRQLLPWKYRLEQTDYTLTPEETSRLLIESFLSIASQREEKSIAFLLEAIQNGNPANRYALMGLLMKATE